MPVTEDDASLDSASESDTSQANIVPLRGYFRDPDQVRREIPTVIYIHGFAGAEYHSWEYRRQGFLPQLVQDHLESHTDPTEYGWSRYIVYKYDVNALFHDAAAFEDKLERVALKLLESITDRVDKFFDPLVMVAHDIGGVVVKKALLLAREYSMFRPTAIDTDRLILFGTPQTTNTSEWEKFLLDFSFALRDLQSGDKLTTASFKEAAAEFAIVTNQFLGSILDYCILSIYQRISGNQNSYRIIVPKSSAVSNTPYERILPRRKSHFELCHFTSEEDHLKLIGDFVLAATFTPKDLDCYRVQYFKLLDTLTPHQGSASLFAGSRPSEASFDWILEDETFRLWKNSARADILQIRGAKGSGKTSMSHFLVQHFAKQEVSKDVVVAAYFFSKEHRDSRTIHALCRSLTVQLLSSRRVIFPRIYEIHRRYLEVANYESNAHRLHRPFISDPHSWYMLRSILATTHDVKIIIIVDAIDECVGQLASFLKEVVDLTSILTSSVKILLSGTGKDIPGKHKALGQALMILLDDKAPMQVEAERSIQAGIDDLVRERPALRAFRDEIFAELCERRPLNILDSSLKLKYLRYGELQSTPQSVRSSLKKTSESAVDAALEHALDITDGGLRKWGTNVLSWMTFAFRPLRLGELATALAMSNWESSSDPQDEHYSRDLEADLKYVLGTIVSVEDNIVRFAHHKIRDLVKDWIKSTLVVHRADTICHRTIFRICVAYLTKDRMRDATKVLEEMLYEPGTQLADLPEYNSNFGLYLYAVQFWSQHYQNRETSLEEDLICAKHFVGKTWSFDHEFVAYQAIGIRRNFRRPPALFAAQLGLADVVKSLRDDKVGDSWGDGFIDELLTTAATSNCVPILQQLLDDGFDYRGDKSTALVAALVAEAPDSVQFLMHRIALEEDDMPQLGTLLQTAASAGQADLVERVCRADHKIFPPLLNAVRTAASTNRLDILQDVLSLALDPKYKDRLHMSPYTAGLDAAVLCGHSKIVEHIMKDFDTDFHKDKVGRSTLAIACMLGFSSFVSMLLDDTNVNDEDNDGRTPLHHCAVYGCVQVAETLIRAGAEIDRKDLNGESPIFLAVRFRQVEMVRLLLEKGAVSQLSNNIGQSLLHAAISIGRLELVKLLVNPNTNLEKSDVSNLTPLVYAILTGFTQEGITFFIDQGADMEATNKHGATALLCAVSKRMPDIVEKLLSKGANPLAQDNWGRTSVHMAAERGCPITLEVLLKYKHDVDATDKSRRTPLHYAAEQGNRGCVECLLQHGAATDMADEYDQRPINYASEGRKFEAGYLLLRDRPQDPVEETALTRLFHSAASVGHFEAVKLILERCQSPYEIVNSKDDSTQSVSALSNAAVGGSLEVTELIFAKGAEIERTVDDAVGPLQCAVRVLEMDMVDLFVKNGANVNQINRDNGTALLVAVIDGSLALTRQLLQLGADANIVDKYRVTPLQRSVKNYQIALELITHGANVRESDSVSNAVNLVFSDHYDKEASPAILDLLFEHGARLEDADVRGMTAVHHASIRGLQSLVESYVEKDPLALTRKDKQGRTALHFAAGGHSPSLVTWMLDRLKLSNLKDHDLADADGWTPLHWSCRNSDARDIWDIFLARGIDISQAANNGWTAADVAEYHAVGHSWEEFLEQRGLYGTDEQTRTKHNHGTSVEEKATDEHIENDSRGNGANTADESVSSTSSGHHEAAVNTANPRKVNFSSSQPEKPPRVDARTSTSSTGSEVSRAASEASNSDSKSIDPALDILDPTTGKPKIAAVPTFELCDHCKFDIYGPKFECEVCPGYNLCFKCAWHKKSQHPFHDFKVGLEPGELLPSQTAGPITPAIAIDRDAEERVHLDNEDDRVSTDASDAAEVQKKPAPNVATLSEKKMSSTKLVDGEEANAVRNNDSGDEDEDDEDDNDEDDDDDVSDNESK